MRRGMQTVRPDIVILNEEMNDGFVAAMTQAGPGVDELSSFDDQACRREFEKIADERPANVQRAAQQKAGVPGIPKRGSVSQTRGSGSAIVVHQVVIGGKNRYDTYMILGQ